MVEGNAGSNGMRTSRPASVTLPAQSATCFSDPVSNSSPHPRPPPSPISTDGGLSFDDALEGDSSSFKPAPLFPALSDQKSVLLAYHQPGYFSSWKYAGAGKELCSIYLQKNTPEQASGCLIPGARAFHFLQPASVAGASPPYPFLTLHRVPQYCSLMNEVYNVGNGVDGAVVGRIYGSRGWWLEEMWAEWVSRKRAVLWMELERDINANMGGAEETKMVVYLTPLEWWKMEKNAKAPFKFDVHLGGKVVATFRDAESDTVNQRFRHSKNFEISFNSDLDVEEKSLIFASTMALDFTPYLDEQTQAD